MAQLALTICLQDIYLYICGLCEYPTLPPQAEEGGGMDEAGNGEDL